MRGGAGRLPHLARVSELVRAVAHLAIVSFRLLAMCKTECSRKVKNGFGKEPQSVPITVVDGLEQWLVLLP